MNSNQLLRIVELYSRKGRARRMKQESRKTGVPANELKKRVRAPQVSKTKKEKKEA